MPSPSRAAVRAHALRTLAKAIEPNRAAADLLRKAADHVASGIAVMSGPLAVSLRDAGLDAVSAQAACRIVRG